MRYGYATATMILVTVLMVPGAVAPETGQGHYTGTLGGGETSTGSYLGFIWCDPKFVAGLVGLETGCVGGDVVPSPSGDLYVLGRTSVTDTASGANVFFWGCLQPADGIHFCEEAVAACGLTVEMVPAVDGEPMPTAWVVAHTLQVDAVTNEVCVGTAGGISVVFVE